MRIPFKHLDNNVSFHIVKSYRHTSVFFTNGSNDDIKLVLYAMGNTK